MEYSSNNKGVAVELLPLYKKRGGTGRWSDKSRKEHHYEQARRLKVPRKFVKELFDREIELGKTLDIGSRIRDKAGIYRKRKTPFDTKNLIKKMNRVKTRKQTCTANATPMCLKVFITNTEDTVCLRCQNIK